MNTSKTTGGKFLRQITSGALISKTHTMFLSREKKITDKTETFPHESPRSTLNQAGRQQIKTNWWRGEWSPLRPDRLIDPSALTHQGPQWPQRWGLILLALVCVVVCVARQELAIIPGPLSLHRLPHTSGSCCLPRYDGNTSMTSWLISHTTKPNQVQVDPHTHMQHRRRLRNAAMNFVISLPSTFLSL